MVVLVDLKKNQIWKVFYENGVKTQMEQLKNNFSLHNIIISLKHVRIIGSNADIVNDILLSFLNSIQKRLSEISELFIENASDPLFAAIGITPNQQTNVKFLTIIGPYAGEIQHATSFKNAESVVLINVDYKFLEGSHSIGRIYLSAMSYEKRFINKLVQQNKDLLVIRLYSKSKSIAMPISNEDATRPDKGKANYFEYVPKSKKNSRKFSERGDLPEAPMVPTTTPQRSDSGESNVLPTATSNVPFILRGANNELNLDHGSGHGTDSNNNTDQASLMDPANVPSPPGAVFYMDPDVNTDEPQKAMPKELPYYADGENIAPNREKKQELLQVPILVKRRSIFGTRESSSSDSLERALLSPVPGHRFAHSADSNQEISQEVESGSEVPTENEPSVVAETDSARSISAGAISDDLYPETDSDGKSNGNKSEREEQSEFGSQHGVSSGHSSQASDRANSERSSTPENSGSDNSNKSFLRLPKFDKVGAIEMRDDHPTALPNSDIDILSGDDYEVNYPIMSHVQCDPVQINDVLFGLREFSYVYVDCYGDSFLLNVVDKTLSTSNFTIPSDIFVDYKLLNFGPFGTEANVRRAVKGAEMLAESFEIVRVFSTIDLANTDCRKLYDAKSTHVAIDMATRANDPNKFGDILKIKNHISLNINDYAIADAIPYNTESLRIFFNVKSEIQRTFEIMLGKQAKSALFVSNCEKWVKIKQLIIARKPIPNYSLKYAVDDSVASNMTDTNGFIEQMMQMRATSVTNLLEHFGELKSIQTSIHPNDAMEWYERLLQQLPLDSIQIRFDDANKEFIAQKFAFFTGLKLDNWEFKLQDGEMKYIYGLKVILPPRTTIWVIEYVGYVFSLHLLSIDHSLHTLFFSCFPH